MEFNADAKGGLIVKVASLWVQWLPVTKVQFERFLCDTGDARFDAKCYAEMLGLNPRVSPRGVTVKNYCQALLTGVLPLEAESVARWAGLGFRLPTDQEWRSIYAALKAEPFRRLEEEAPLAALGERDRELLARIETAAAGADGASERYVADQMLLRGGVFEWVDDAGGSQRWGGRGMPRGGFHRVEDAKPVRFNEPDTRRLKACGFRLVRAAA